MIAMPDDRIPASLYEQDLDAWAMNQAAALRAVGGALSHGQKNPADLLLSLHWDNLAEEIEGWPVRTGVSLLVVSRSSLTTWQSSNSAARWRLARDGSTRCCVSGRKSRRYSTTARPCGAMFTIIGAMAD
jgi:hypothetical protein